ncbi:hypothetical protein D3C85_1071760 [compost metagenome]
MGREDYVVQGLEHIRHLRFGVEHIQRGAGDPALLQGGDQVGGGNHAGPGNVDDKTLGAQGVEDLAIDQVLGAQPAWRGDDQEVRGARQFGRGRAERVGHIAATLAIVVADAHVEAGTGTFGDGHADRAEAEDAQAFAREGRAHDLRPLAAPNGGVTAGHITDQR